MKDYRRSHHRIEAPVVLTINYSGCEDGKVLVVLDNRKYGKDNKIVVYDPETGKKHKIPTKYLDDLE